MISQGSHLKHVLRITSVILVAWLIGSIAGCAMLRNPYGEDESSRIRDGWSSSKRIPIRSSFGDR